MRGKLALAAIAAIGLIGITGHARAHTYAVNCGTGMIVQDSNPAMSESLGGLIGTPAGPASGTPYTIASGDTVELSGLCAQDITVRTSGVTIANDSDTSSFNSLDGLSAQLEILGATRVTVNGILLGWTSQSSNSFPGTGEDGNVYVHEGSAVLIENCDITDGTLSGIFAVDGVSIAVQTVTISGNGTAGTVRNDAGIRAANNVSVVLGTKGGTNNVTVSGNAGAGIEVIKGSSLTAWDATIDSNGTDQLLLSQGANGYITSPSIICQGSLSGSTCTPASTQVPAITVEGLSVIQLDASGGAPGVLVTGGTTSAALLVGGTSVAAIQGSVFVAPSSAFIQVIEASANSSIVSYGGNLVCAGSYSGSCSPTSGNVAIQVDHVSSFTQQYAATQGYTAAADTVYGGSYVEEQSTMDLGIGLIPSSPSMNWTTGSLGIQVEQNSSFRLSGGVDITGTVELGQGSNGFFNTNNGGTDVVSGGVSCPFNHYAASHVTTPQNVGGGGVNFVATGVVPTTSPVCMTF